MSESDLNPPNPPMDQPMPFLGRRPSKPDPRDRRFAARRAASPRTARSWLHTYVPRNQGDTPHCVAFSGAHYLEAGPVVNNRKLPNTTDLYNECQRLDEWDGEDYDGTSVRALMKVLKSKGYITRYEWAYDVETVVNHLLEVGPVLAGTTWTWNMFDIDRHGYIWPDAYAVGGHAYMLIAVNRKRKNPDGTIGAVRMLNSWGPEWGEKGRAWITFDKLKLLIDDYGEMAIPVEADIDPPK